MVGGWVGGWVGGDDGSPKGRRARWGCWARWRRGGLHSLCTPRAAPDLPASSCALPLCRLGGYDLHDLVVLDATTVGVIVGVEADSVKVLTNQVRGGGGRGGRHAGGRHVEARAWPGRVLRG